ncbi:hypothetical protein ALC62_05229 [Cyphomyrmex costatus]|uniref:Uncharacterized protein n=1 Tax=Cyphomyrmex costatus TaxID=456900 RepID=A0A151IJV8_9HYME|nr:hypothetical protein ALC62_05229 [Cyphomyrmex costatus]
MRAQRPRPVRGTRTAHRYGERSSDRGDRREGRHERARQSVTKIRSEEERRRRRRGGLGRGDEVQKRNDEDLDGGGDSDSAGDDGEAPPATHLNR